MNFIGSSLKPYAIKYMNKGIRIWSKQAIVATEIIKTNNISCEKLIAFPLPTKSLLENIGTKTAEKAPSAVILLKIFGNLRAVKKASATIVTPRILLIRISLINPANLLTSVKIATVKVDLKNEFFFSAFSMIKISLIVY